jgi:hypothetical protein
VLFPTKVAIASSSEFVRALGFLRCKLQYGCCGLSLADPDIESICSSSLSETSDMLDGYLREETAGLVTFSPDSAAKCASMLLGYLNQLVNSGVCSISLEGAGYENGASLFASGSLAQQSGVDINGLVFAVAYCRSNVFAPAVAVGGSCAYPSDSGGTSTSDDACTGGLYCRESFSADGPAPVCAAHTPLGSPCDPLVYGDCVDGAWCRTDATSGVCVAYKKLGETCVDGTDSCESGSCTQGVCDGDGQYLSAVGEPCYENADCASGLCKTETVSCLPRVEVPAGSPCANLPGDTACAAGLRGGGGETIPASLKLVGSAPSPSSM